MQGCSVLLLLLVFVCGWTGGYAGQDRARREADNGGNSDQENPEVVQHCMECVQDITDDDDTLDIEGEFADCVADCVIEPENCYLHQYCPQDSRRVLADVSSRKWRPFKKLGSWYRKNKDKILNGLNTAGTIIGATGKK
ncbi:hypothetical protein MAR_026091 [Mya arenaria]|uniref:Uncharacterized protein n=1 Tax=Mya arenaria TaxID=6604 RepID=A0ABY7ESX6_MYAAR|nr:uncharacterized protein LOC128242081 [Mya arenaria]XP_052815171.1 uncharacterized protein LOC128242145 [Mya arenaria]WAR11911.1 hypothetical protein MAR_026091 [Mya arenaria]